MLFRSYCTAAIAALATSTATAKSTSSVRGVAHEDSSAAHHRVLSGVTGKYLEQLIEYSDDSFGLADNPNGVVDRRLRELQGNSGNSNRGGNGRGNGNGPQKQGAFELPNGVILEFEGLTAEDEASLSPGDDIILPAEATMSGTKINVHGRPIGRPPNAGNRQGRKLATLTGDKTVVGVRVVTSCNDQTTSSEADLTSYIFDDAVNLSKQYKACSHDQLNFIKPSDAVSSNTALASNIVDGVLTVNINRCATAEEDDSVMRNEITEAINSAFGVSSPTEIADHFMYCLPPNTFGGIAYAYFNHWMSVYKDDWCNYVSAQLHEVGHNLNFGHSSEGTEEYGDKSGMMGFSYSQNDSPVMCFNGAKAWQSGWFADKSLSIDPNNDAGTCYSGALYGQDSYTSSPADAKVLIQLQSTSGTHYHIGFNGKQGSNVGTVEHGDRVIITSQAATGASMKIANLGAGESYTIANYDGSGRDVTVSVTSVSGSDHAFIDIQCGPALCTSNDQCNDNNICTSNLCDGACNFLPIDNCCGNGICEASGGETFSTCFGDCADGPFDLQSDLCSSCYLQDGNMFEVKAKAKDLAITSLSTRTYAVGGATGTFGLEVWTKSGTMIGFESSQASWTKVADVSVTSGAWEMIPVEFDPVHISAGQTQSFYVTHKDGGKAIWTGGNPVANTIVSEDDSLEIFNGYYNVYPFGGKGLGTWNGVMTYVTDNGVPTTLSPTPPPTNAPVDPPSPPPSANPTSLPTANPTALPTPLPTSAPTPLPTLAPVSPPTNPPTSPPVASVDKFICTKNEPLPATICADGAPVGGKCADVGTNSSCGRGGKVCWWASCPGDGPSPPTPLTPPPTASPPSPSPPPPPSPPTGCSICAATGEPCCGTCVSGGKPSNRGCFL